MPRYIDADVLYEKIYPLDLADKRRYAINAQVVADAINNAPTADVVPRDEVAKIFEEIEQETVAALESNYKWMREHNVIGNTVSESVMQRVYGKIDALRGIEGFIEDLKEKHTKGGEQ